MKKGIARIICIALAVLSVGLAASCRKVEIKTGDVDQDLTVTDLAIRGRVRLTYDNSNYTEEMNTCLRSFATAFMAEYPDAEVVLDGASRSAFGTRISSGDIGDVFWCDENDVNNYHFNHNALMPLDAYIKPMGIDMGNIYSGAIDCGRFDSRLYMVPRNIGLSAVIYNADMLKEAGITFDNTRATSWDDFKTICRQVTVTGDDGKILRAGFSLRLWWDVIWQMFFRGFGGEWVDSVNHRITITDSAEVMRGIQEMYDGVMEGWLYPLGQNLSGSVAEKFSEIPNDDSNFTKVAFLYFMSFTYLDSFGQMYDTADTDWDFCPFPAFPNHTVSAGATGYSVYNRTSNPDTAAALALYFLTENGQRAYHSQMGGDVPLLKSLAEEDFWRNKSYQWPDKNYDVFVSYTDNTRPATVIVQCPFEVREVLSNEKMLELWNNVLNGKTDLQTAFGIMQREANERWMRFWS